VCILSLLAQEKEGDSGIFVPPENDAKKQEDCSKYVADVDRTFYEDYQKHLKTYGKIYKCETYVRRLDYYTKKRRDFEEFNRAGKFSFTKGANYFTDVFDEERLKYYTGVPEKDDSPPEPNVVISDDTSGVGLPPINGGGDGPDPEPVRKNTFTSSEYTCCLNNPFGVPCSKDWVSLGKVTSVKNQGGCGSCWAFAADASMESAYLIKYGVSYNLSEQELVDCSWSYGNHGCSGGWPHKALDYIVAKRNYREAYVPYLGFDSICVAPNVVKVPAKARTLVLPQNHMGIFLQKLNAQPIAVVFKVVGSLFDYAGGIYDPAADPSCASGYLNHAVTAVAYNVGCTPFIKFKNSWGAGWGEAGFFRMKLAKTVFQNGPCNLINHPYNVYPSV